LVPNLVLAALVVLLLWFGIFPQPVLGLIREAVAGLA
jgi:NADH:ubiquinone oxidoreductase subunit 4 (subunit M)